MVTESIRREILKGFRTSETLSLIHILYFRLKQAYLAYVSREYVVFGRDLDLCVFDMIANECDKKEYLPDICKVALLKYYSSRDYTAELEDVLHYVLREMCEKQIVFPYYLKYKEEWLREVQLYDKVMIDVYKRQGWAGRM